ncbi:type III secretion system protein SsaM [Kosakonia sp. BYX6]|uniref:Type III secretion system protein SsaM n=1 Tax=Kosakonia calanthes TaxID=3139408 RepID=A0ABZ3B4P0_9ENTR
MEWDLVTQRNIQLFIRLAGLAHHPLAADMQWRQAHYQTHLGYRHGRVSLCQLFPHSPFDKVRLLTLLSDWRPSAFYGIPQRVFQVRKGLAISCSPPPDSSAELWLQLHRRQIALMGSR